MNRCMHGAIQCDPLDFTCSYCEDMTVTAMYSSGSATRAKLPDVLFHPDVVMIVFEPEVANESVC